MSLKKVSKKGLIPEDARLSDFIAYAESIGCVLIVRLAPKEAAEHSLNADTASPRLTDALLQERAEEKERDNRKVRRAG